MWWRVIVTSTFLIEECEVYPGNNDCSDGVLVLEC